MEIFTDIDITLEILRALGSQTRITILNILLKEPKRNADLAKILNLSPSTISLHMKILYKCRLVYVKKEGGSIYYYIEEKNISQFLFALKGKIAS